MNLSILARCGLFRGIKTTRIIPAFAPSARLLLNSINFSRFTASAIPRMRCAFCSRAA